MILKIHDLAFSWPSAPVLKGISLQLSEGEVVAIIGKNGAGKSTMLRCINHIVKPTGGAVYVNGRDLQRMPDRERARQIGYLSQKSSQIFSLSVFEVVLMGRYPHSPLRFTKVDEEIVADILDQMELGDYANRQFYQLSGGEQQQVLIARALAQGSDVLLFDEPTNNLDLRHQLEIMRRIRRVAKEKRITSLIAIHDLNLAAAFADRLIIMHQGKIFAAGAPAQVLTEEALAAVFGVRVKIYDHHGTPHIVLLAEELPHSGQGRLDRLQPCPSSSVK